MSAEIIEKWIVGDKRQFGQPTSEWFILTPRHLTMKENWYFRLAAMKIFDEEIRWAGVQQQQMQDWYDREEEKRKETNEQQAKEAG